MNPFRDPGKTYAYASAPRVALVTGASSGIGRATARALSRRGLTVFGTSRGASGEADDAGVRMLPLDVRSADSVAACVEAVRARAGDVEILVNNAGYALLGAIEETTVAEAQAQFDTNFFGVVRMVRAVLPAMRERRSGTIVNIGSVAGLVAMPFGAFYSASKFALEGFTEGLRHEVRPFGIHVSVVEPGFVRTNIGEAGQTAAAGNAAYEGPRSRAAGVVAASVRSGIDADEVAATVVRIVESRDPRLRYRVGRDAAWVPRLKQVSPPSVFEAVTRRLFRLDSGARRT
jgi:NAD(P)-dependent dehydrogenase (short-subunit alcohol dehydrogenase family)